MPIASHTHPRPLLLWLFLDAKLDDRHLDAVGNLDLSRVVDVPGLDRVDPKRLTLDDRLFLPTRLGTSLEGANDLGEGRLLLDRRLVDGDSPGAAGRGTLLLRQGHVDLARIHVLRIVEEEGVAADRLPGAGLVEAVHLNALLKIAKRCLDPEPID